MIQGIDITRALSFNVATTWIKNKKEDFALFGFFYEGRNIIIL